MWPVLLVSVYLVPAGALGQGGADAVAGSLARGEAIFSGRIAYSVASGTDATANADEYEFTFSGTSWKQKSSADASAVPRSFSKGALPAGIDPKTIAPLHGVQEMTVVSHRGRLIKYQSVPQDDLRVRKTARVEAGDRSMRDENPPRPQFAGTFWFASTQKYVSENRARGKFKGNDKVAGYDVEVYEWAVPAADAGSAFRSFNALTQGGGVLRAYIAPSLGFAVPRVEHVGTSGAIGAVLDASDFFQSGGFHFPRRARIQYVGPAGPTFATSYKITRVEAVNEAIPDSEFAVLLPVGTEVADARDGKQSLIFEVTDPASVPDSLSDVMKTERPSGGWFRSWKGGVVLGLVLGTAALVALAVIRRVRSKSS